VIARRSAFRAQYQNRTYARYEAIVARVRSAERALGSETVTDAVARSLFKLMAYKDEYEVARLHIESAVLGELRAEYEGDFKIRYHLVPPFLPAKKGVRGRPRRRAFGQRMQLRLKVLSGTHSATPPIDAASGS
jgi:indolepyruvate ferredoxin oxidoreductase